ncbi:MAG: hypothetical protein U0Z44_20495 [Kouleothrix sp.]
MRRSCRSSERLNREQGMTIILVTHEPDIAAHARRIIRRVLTA